jgi:hypothetical protein
MFGHDEETGVENENWSSLSAAMLTLFTYVTVRINVSNYYNRACRNSMKFNCFQTLPVGATVYRQGQISNARYCSAIKFFSIIAG